MTILGIHGDYFNPRRLVFESNAAVVSNGRIVAALSEERLSREKLDGRFPHRAIAEALRVAGCGAGDVDAVALSSRKPAGAILAYAQSAWTTWLDTGVLAVNPRKAGALLQSMANKLLGRTHGNGRAALPGLPPPVFYDHHRCHAAGAYYASPFDEALVLTLDGGGDGLDGSVYVGRGAALRRVCGIPHFQSPGTLYSAITHDLGFRRHRHEGKITGLAAYGDPGRALPAVRGLMRYDARKHRFIAPQVARHHRNLETKSAYLSPLVEEHGREDVSAAVQRVFEEVIVELAGDAHRLAGFTSSVNLCLAGGCFSNVRLNQKLFELPFVENVYVFPAMGDGGLGAGAALLHAYEAGGMQGKVRARDDMYLGGRYGEAEMEAALKAAGLPFERPANAEDETARLLAEGKVVARFDGAMEYGPRALGNRSILAAPFDPSINDWLNKKLRRTEFMPFAPSVTEEAAVQYFEGYAPGQPAAEFMTITYAVRASMREKIPAVVHVDHTARPQVVRQAANPGYHAVIGRFGQRTGVPVVLNTSFNIHEEPIVYTPADAVRGFLDARLDYLAMGPFLCALPR